MVNIQQWDEFQKAAEELYLLSPNTTRYVTKYRHVDGKLVLKVTDDRTVLKYKTDQMQDLNKFERLNRSLMAKMHNRTPAPVTETSAPVAVPSTLAPAQPAATVTISSPSIQQGGGGKKKNRRK
ncbi:Signal recognition particle protein [Entomortierella lignicola]|nr:Signal recognition particle protein [Entomortierella lignicola]